MLSWVATTREDGEQPQSQHGVAQLPAGMPPGRVDQEQQLGDAHRPCLPPVTLLALADAWCLNHMLL